LSVDDHIDIVGVSSRIQEPPKYINDVISALVRHNFGMKAEDYLNDYLSGKKVQQRAQEVAWMMHPHLFC
jgi:hypothetical protein